jgi:hypothetical protein
MKISLWLKDGSIYRDCTLTSANIKIDGAAFDISKLDRIDDAYIYTIDAAQIYRDHASGNIHIATSGVADGLTINLSDVSVLDHN